MKSIIAFIYHNSSEKRSLSLLSLFIGILLTVSWIIKKQHVPEVVDFSNYDSLFHESIDSNIIQKINTQPYKKSVPKAYSSKEKSIPSGYTFDPNYISKDTLQLLGLNVYASNNLIKYREKGGRIAKPEDLKKIYGVTDKMYAAIKARIKIKEASFQLKSLNTKPVSVLDTNNLIKKVKKALPLDSLKRRPDEKRYLIDINKADDIQLEYVKGIGPSFAKRILKYRKLIGGFHSKAQLLEVYGLDIKKYNEIKDHITISDNVDKMNINTLHYELLGKHPYISYPQAKLIVAYRKKHGPYEHVYDILKIGIMDSSFIEKILPYIPDSLMHYKAQTPLTSL